MPSAIVETRVAEDGGPIVATVLSEDGEIRFLTSGKSVVGAQFTGAEFRDQAAFAGFAVQQSVMFAKPRAKRVLQLGLGAGIVPGFLRDHNIRVDVVELSEPVLYMAERHFGYDSCCLSAAATNCSKASGRQRKCEEELGWTALQEAREFLFDSSIQAYDIVLNDVFMGSNPGHLYSFQVFQRIKSEWLLPSGLLAVNFVGLHRGPGSEGAVILARTLRRVFKIVHCFRDQAPDDEPDFATNIVCFASDAAFEFDLPYHQPELVDPLEGSSFWIMKHFQKWEVLKPEPDNQDGEVYTDDFNSLLVAGAQRITEEKLWTHSQEMIPPAVWGHLLAVAG